MIQSCIVVKIERFSFEEPLLDQAYHPTSMRSVTCTQRVFFKQKRLINSQTKQCLQCEIHHDDGHYIYTQVKTLKVLYIRKEQLLMFSCHSGKFHLAHDQVCQEAKPSVSSASHHMWHMVMAGSRLQWYYFIPHAVSHAALSWSWFCCNNFSSLANLGLVPSFTPETLNPKP